MEIEYEDELDKNIIKKIKKFNMASEVNDGKINRFLPYLEKSGLVDKESNILEEYIDDYTYDDYINEFIVAKGMEILHKKLYIGSN